jgi:thiol-disulfide isomerase/thioredoxin
MKPIVFFAAFSVVARLAFAAATGPVTDIGQRVPQFTAPLITFAGDTQQTTDFDSHKTKRVTAYIFVGVTCPATNAYAARLQQLERQYAPKGVDFLFIYPNSNDTRDAKLVFQKQHFLGGLIDDQGARLARLFKAQRTSELFVVNKKGIIVYHGAIDDSRDPTAVKQRYLATALDEVLAGKPVTVATSTVFA